MAEKWDAAILADVSSTDLSKGGKVWNATLVGGRKFKTFSKTAGPVLEANVSKTVVAEVEVSGQFRGQDEYALLKLWDGQGTLLYEPSADEKKKAAGKGGGGGGRPYVPNPEWSFRNPEERWHERMSYEAQHAATVAAELAKTLELGEKSAVEFVVQAIPQIAKATREAASSYEVPASYQARMKTSGAGAETPKSSSKGAGPAPAKAPDSLSNQHRQKLDLALGAFESPGKLLARYNRTLANEHGKATEVEGIPEVALDLMIRALEQEEAS